MHFTWDIDPVIVHISGPFGLRYYGLIFSLVFIGGYLLYRWQILRGGGTEDDVYAMVLPSALGTIVGARLGHVFFYGPMRALENPLWIFQVWRGGLASHGALIGLTLAIWYYSRKMKRPIAECGDRFTFTGALGATLVRVGNFFNSEIVGRVTGGDWGVRFPRFDYGLPLDQVPLRHPSQLYEAALGLIVMGVLLAADRRMGGEKRPRGVLTALFLVTYFSGRFLVEFFKERQTLPYSVPLSMGQFLSIPAVLIGAVWLYKALKHPVPAGWAAPSAPETEGAKGRKRTGKPKTRKSGRGKK